MKPYGISMPFRYILVLCGMKYFFYPWIETRYASTKVMNIDLLEKINTGNFRQGSAISKIKYYNPNNLTLLIKIMTLKMPFSTDTFIN